MLELLKSLTCLDGTSGDEDAVRDFIITKIDGNCEWKIDPLGNILAFKKGKKRAVKRLLIDAHTDEVGLIITSVTADGFLKFKTVGGIDTAVLLSRQVRIGGSINGVIGSKPIHLTSGDEGKKLPKADSLYIDIGAQSREEALEYVSVGDRAVMCGEYHESGELICSKALDDRIGCAILIKLLCEESEYDFSASFSVQEEIGLRGARTAAYTIDPEAAIMLEATTAADISGVPDERSVCRLGSGAAVSFMDNATVYDRKFYNAALNSGIKCQPKCAVAGGNNSGVVHLSRSGVRSLAISVPCRYIHSATCVCNRNDIENSYQLAKFMLCSICSGETE